MAFIDYWSTLCKQAEGNKVTSWSLSGGNKSDNTWYDAKVLRLHCSTRIIWKPFNPPPHINISNKSIHFSHKIIGPTSRSSIGGVNIIIERIKLQFSLKNPSPPPPHMTKSKKSLYFINESIVLTNRSSINGINIIRDRIQL